MESVHENPHFLLKDPEQIRTVESLRRLDRDGHMYYMDCTWDYYHPGAELLPMIDAGCSAFITSTFEGERLHCRSYDYSHYLHNDKTNPRTGINCVVHTKHPQARYESISVTDAFWLDREKARIIEGTADDGKTDISVFAMLPYLCMDGVNTAGFSVSILALTSIPRWEPIPFEAREERIKGSGKDPLVLEVPGETPKVSDGQSGNGRIAINEKDRKAWVCRKESVRQDEPGKRALFHPFLMRFMLDSCATVEEAVRLAESYNIRSSMPEGDFHLFLTDRSGQSALLEWVSNRMNVLWGVRHATNYWLSLGETLGSGIERDGCLAAGLARFPKGMTEDSAECLLRIVCQDPRNPKWEGKTQYSVIYNLDRSELKVWSYGDFSCSWRFAVDGTIL